MRLVGTGKDPENRYPEGLVFDAPEHVAKRFVEDGLATIQHPVDDAGRTPSQIAQADVRGDNLSDPVDAEIADGLRGRGEDPEDGPQSASIVQDGDQVDEPINTDVSARTTPYAGEPTGEQATALEEGEVNPDGPYGSGTAEGLEEHEAALPGDADGDGVEGGSYDEDVFASRAAETKAEELNVNPADIEGSSKDGKVTVADVEKAHNADAE